jgi:glycosyltransferase involved in cell wall biosynthesis
MKILFVTEFWPDAKKVFTGGVEARTWFTVDYLRRRHSVKVISRRTALVAADLRSGWSRMWFMIRAVIEGWRGAKVDVVEGSNVICYLPAFLIAKIKKAVAVAWVADILGPDWRHFGWLTGSLGWSLEWLSFRLPWDQVIALSQQTKKKLVAGRVNPERIRVIYPGIDQGEFTLPGKKRAGAIICMIARLVAYKRVADGVKLTAELASELAGLKLLVIGAGPEKRRLAKLAQNLGVAGRIYWKSRLPRKKLVQALKSCRVLCHLSVVEGFGLVMLEAVAAGLPYVAYATPINQEVTDGGEGGVLVPVGNWRRAAAAVKLLLTDRQFYRQKAAEGKKLLKNYSWVEAARQTEAIYGSLVPSA